MCFKLLMQLFGNINALYLFINVGDGFVVFEQYGVSA